MGNRALSCLALIAPNAYQVPDTLQATWMSPLKSSSGEPEGQAL